MDKVLSTLWWTSELNPFDVASAAANSVAFAHTVDHHHSKLGNGSVAVAAPATAANYYVEMDAANHTGNNTFLAVDFVVNCTSSMCGGLLLRNDTLGGNLTDGNMTRVDDDELDKDFWRMVESVSIAVILGIVILATVIGNVFVIAAILLERHLQSVANYLILSLAVADLLVACLVMPLGAVYEVSKEWRLGPELCDMWTSSDVLCCTASILHLVAIALDRYWAVTNIDYVHQRTARRIGIMILIVWALSFLVSAAPLLGWKDDGWEERVAVNLTCIVSQDIAYQIFATSSSFYVPLLVILILYWRIFQTARKRIRRRHHNRNQQTSNAESTPGSMGGRDGGANANAGGLSAIASAAGGSGTIAAAVVTMMGRPLPTISEMTTTTTAFTNVSSTNTTPEKTAYGNGLEQQQTGQSPAGVSPQPQPPPPQQHQLLQPQQPPSSMQQVQQSQRRTPDLRQRVATLDSKRERKAAKTLAIITGAFVCCWLPFFIVAIVMPACAECDVSPLLMSLCLWLGYFNSTLNPIIYTIFSPEFRHAFKRILFGVGPAAAARRRRLMLGRRHLGLKR